MGQKFFRWCIFVGGVRRWKVRTYIACAHRAQNGIGSRMQRHIGIGMAEQFVRMGYAYTTQHNVIALGKAVYVKARSNARFQQGLLHTIEIVLGCDFGIGDAAGHRLNAKPRAFQHRSIIGQFQSAHGAVGCNDFIVMKSLRRLRSS